MVHAEKSSSESVKAGLPHEYDHNSVNRESDLPQDSTIPNTDPVLNEDALQKVTFMEPSDQPSSEGKDGLVSSENLQPEDDDDGSVAQVGTGVGKKKRKKKPKSQRGLVFNLSLVISSITGVLMI